MALDATTGEPHTWHHTALQELLQLIDGWLLVVELLLNTRDSVLNQLNRVLERRENNLCATQPTGNIMNNTYIAATMSSVDTIELTSTSQK